MRDVVIIGFGGHAKSILDSIKREQKYNVVGYTDNVQRDSEYKYLGTDEVLGDLYNSGVRNAVLGVGYIGGTVVRDAIVKNATNIGFEFPEIIDPTATIAGDVVIGRGTFVGKNVVINAGSRIGSFCIINTGAVVEHECVVNDCSHISVGVILCGQVVVGNHTMVGAGSTIIQCLEIGNNCSIGANSTVLSNIQDNLKVYGIVK